MKKIKLKVVNMVYVGKIPIKRKLSIEGINKIINESDLEWIVVNQEKKPMLVVRKDGTGKTKKNVSQRISCTLWHSGYICISGVKSRTQAVDFAQEIVKDIKEIEPCLFKKKIKS